MTDNLQNEEQERLYAPTPESSIASNMDNLIDHNNNFDQMLTQENHNNRINGQRIEQHHAPSFDAQSITSENLSDTSSMSTNTRNSTSKIQYFLKYINFNKSQYLKAFTMFLYAGLCTFICSLLLILTHMRLNERAREEPLQDIISEFITPTPEPYEHLFKICEAATGIYVVFLLSISFYRQDRAKIFQRFFFTFGTLFLYRGFLMYMTLLPRPSKSLNCEYQINSTSQIIQDTITFWLSMGLSANGEHKYCGDYMYSGHTATILCLHLYILEYFPKSKTKGLRFVKKFFNNYLPWVVRFNHWKLLIKIPMTIFSTVAILAILITHNHYTIDVVIAYFFVTREFMLYHSSFKLGLQHSSTRIIKATNPKQYVDDVNEHDNLPRQNVQVNRNNDVGIVIEAENQPIAQVESFNEILAGDGGYTQFQSNSRNQSGESDDNIKNNNNNNKAEHNLHGWWWPIFKWLEQDTW